MSSETEKSVPSKIEFRTVKIGLKPSSGVFLVVHGPESFA